MRFRRFGLGDLADPLLSESPSETRCGPSASQRRLTALIVIPGPRRIREDANLQKASIRHVSVVCVVPAARLALRRRPSFELVRRRRWWKFIGPRTRRVVDSGRDFARYSADRRAVTERLAKRECRRIRLSEQRRRGFRGDRPASRRSASSHGAAALGLIRGLSIGQRAHRCDVRFTGGIDTARGSGCTRGDARDNLEPKL